MEKIDEKENVIKITKEEFYFNTGLYSKIKISNLDEEIFRGEVDGFSPSNKIETTFKVTNEELLYSIDEKGFRIDGYFPARYYNGIFDIKLICKRKNEILSFYVYINHKKGYIEKIGQLPSFADMITSKIDNKYSKILGEDWKNFKKATGLFSHGIGIGSYVYLRKIFENLIFETFTEKITNLQTSKEDFIKLHMDEKVEVLKDYLPKFLVRNKKIYSVLSIGLHKMNEENCLKYFPALKDSIILILDQKIKIIEDIKKEKSTSNNFQEILSEIKN